MGNPICGIYKITSPTGRIYIGESKNIKRRLSQYRGLHGCSQQPKLLNSIKKHGWENHIFEIIEECDLEDLKCRERFWQDEFDVLNGGLNCKLTECGEEKAVHSEETIEKIRQSKMGDKNPMYGKNFSPLHRQRIGIQTAKNKKGMVHSDETRQKMRENHADFKGEKNPMYGTKRPDMSERNRENTGKYTAKNNPNTKIIIDIEEGGFYFGLEDAGTVFSIRPAHLSRMLTGTRNNKTNLMYLNEYLNKIYEIWDAHQK